MSCLNKYWLILFIDRIMTKEDGDQCMLNVLLMSETVVLVHLQEEHRVSNRHGMLIWFLGFNLPSICLLHAQCSIEECQSLYENYGFVVYDREKRYKVYYLLQRA